MSAPHWLVPLRRIAHGRTGDKGDRSSISVIAYREAFWPILLEQVTEQAVSERFAFRRPQAVTRHLLPRLYALNFVLDGVLDGGVNDSLNLDSHGKALSFLLLDLRVRVPQELVPLLSGDAGTDADEGEPHPFDQDTNHTGEQR
jgi:hypothetical protein